MINTFKLNQDTAVTVIVDLSTFDEVGKLTLGL